jgi:solute carrier family 25 protein 16
MRGLLQGHSATLLRIFPYAGIKFMAYDFFHLVRSVEVKTCQADFSMQLLMPRRELETGTRLYAAGALSGRLPLAASRPV